MLNPSVFKAMRTVEIPDALYEEAASRAAAQGQSIEEFVRDGLIARLDEGPLRLTPEQLEIIDQAEADIDAGNFYTSEQLRERLAQNRADWLRENAA